jgi:diphthamide synthase (EF-2-diphthine--ammonia ligase)
LANILRITDEGHLVQVELLNIFEEQENVDDHMINRRLAQKVSEDMQVKVPESTADSSEESVLDAATASCSVTDQPTGFTTGSVTESAEVADPADRTQNSSFEAE